MKPESKSLLARVSHIPMVQERDLFCDTVKRGVDYDPQGEGMRWSPEAFYYYGECHVGGWSNQSPNIDVGRDYLERSAKCGEEKAQVALKQYGWVVPEEECREGDRFFFCSSSCGMANDFTATGLILGGPFLLVGGLVLGVAAILALPLCAISSPIHGNTCM